MGHIYYELNEIPTPPNAHAAGNRVYLDYPIGGGETRRLYIGMYARKDENTFYPNEAFRVHYPGLWEQHYGPKMVQQHVLHMGLYTMALAIGYKTNLYPILHKVYGPLLANGLYDYALYSIKERSNVTYLFKPCMESEVLFSKDRNDENWLCSMFKDRMDENLNYTFKVEWVLECKNKGLKAVWLAIDGSNSDNESDTTLSAPGKAKSHKNTDIVSYIWAINVDDGTPVTFFMNDGGLVDAKAFLEVCEFLAAYEIEIKGVIIDKGFLSHDVLDIIIDKNYEYLINLKTDNSAHKEMLEKYGNTIYWNLNYLIGLHGLFGITDGPYKVFSSYSNTAYVSLFYDGTNGNERKVALSDKIVLALKAINTAIEKGRTPTVPAAVKDFIEVIEIDEDDDKPVVPQAEGNPSETLGENASKEDNTNDSCGSNPVTAVEDVQGSGKETQGDNADSPSDSKGTQPNGNEDNGQMPKQKKYKIIRKCEAYDDSIFKKGFSSLASSIEMSAEEANRIYHLRDVAEKAFMVDKSMLGYDVFRSHSKQGILSREVVCFIAAIIRNYHSWACKQLNLKSSRSLEEADEHLYVIERMNGTYIAINKLKEPEKRLFRFYGITDEDLDTLAGDISERTRARIKGGGGVSQKHILPKAIRERNTKKKSKETTQNAPEEEKEAKDTTQDAPEEEKKSEDTTQDTLDEEKEACQDANDSHSTEGTVDKPPVVSPHRGPGRPPGSKNKKTLEREAAGVQEPKKPGRGRKKGSKNRKTLEREALGIIPKPKQSIGRPKGKKDSKPRVRRTKAQILADQQKKDSGET